MSVLAADGTTYGVNLDAYPGAPSLARQFISQLCDLWGVEGYVPENALLLVSELVTNAFRATSLLVGPKWGRYIVVRASITASELRVEVLDHSPNMPVVQQSDAHTEDGRGLILVNELADDWGCHPATKHLVHEGKAVWFLLKLTEPPLPRSARPAHKQSDREEVIRASLAAPHPADSAQDPEMHPPLPHRAKYCPASPQTRPSIPSRRPTPSAYGTNAATVGRLQAALLGRAQT